MLLRHTSSQVPRHPAGPPPRPAGRLDRALAAARVSRPASVRGPPLFLSQCILLPLLSLPVLTLSACPTCLSRRRLAERDGLRTTARRRTRLRRAAPLQAARRRDPRCRALPTQRLAGACGRPGRRGDAGSAARCCKNGDERFQEHTQSITTSLEQPSLQEPPPCDARSDLASMAQVERGRMPHPPHAASCPPRQRIHVL